MHLKKQIIAFVIAILMIASLGAVSASTKSITPLSSTPQSSAVVTAGATPTALTISAPATVDGGEQFSITGLLTANNVGLGNRTVWLQELQSSIWFNQTSMKTNVDGNYAFTDSRMTGIHQYRVIYPGSATYANSTSPTATVSVSDKYPTALTIGAPSSAQVSQPFQIAGTLTTYPGNPFGNRTVWLQRFDGNTWTNLTSMKTNATTGTYAFSRTESVLNTYQYRTYYAGSATYGKCVSPTATVSISTKTPTSLAIAAPSTAPVNQPFSITGQLTTSNVGLSNRTVWLQTNTSGTWTNLTSQKTDTNGYYSFSRTESTTGNYQYRVIYPGSTTYAPSTSNPRTIILSASKIPTYLDLTASISGLVNQPITILGSLYTASNYLPNRTLSLQRLDGSTWTTLDSQKTNDFGYVDFSRIETAAGTFQYRIIYASSPTYANATSPTATVNVKNPTALSINAPVTAKATGFQITGQLTANGIGLGSAPVTCQWRPANSTTWNTLNTKTTDATGNYSFGVWFTSAGTFEFRTTYDGNSTCTGSTSPAATVTVTMPTTLTLNHTATGTYYYADIGEHVNLSGYLMATNGHTAPTAIANKSIHFYWRLVGQTVWNAGAVHTTDGSGYYHDFASSSVVQSIEYKAVFNGDTQFDASSSPVVTVIFKYRTNINLYASEYNPPAGMDYTLTGWLQDSQGNPMVNAIVHLEWRYPPSTSWRPFVPSTLTTNNTGYFSTIDSSYQTIEYRASYDGDDTHWGIGGAPITVTPT